MAIICPNKNDPAWKKLVAGLGGGERGEARAYIAFFRNGDEIPNVKTALALLFENHQRRRQLNKRQDPPSLRRQHLNSKPKKL